MNLKIENPPVTLRELCLDKVRNAIITGYFPSGKRLVERTLCEELGVSRSVVREVIRYLEAEGLVEILPNKGPIVSLLNWDIASQIYEIRLLLEQSAVVDCTKNLDEKTAEKLKLLLEDLKAAFAADDINLIIATSTRLYETIFTTANHHIAWEVVQRLNGRISRLRAMTMKSTKREISGYQRIKNMCEAIYLHKDPEKAKQAVAEHIAEAAAVAKNILDA
ncbi:TPA: GntR family transcriptional regulator [Acinetobacter baumannii]|jgi:DNA-binding GntR family transcriptional regulator|uniref:Transcriptional regulator, GntR family n=39 Tax=Gammaproteobacteria TaxID=1236 RepID=D0C8H6_ACIB2|nr:MULTISPECIES: GntR family transcriptional regulator [Acinetobacter]ADX91957.1 transcriptional regulator [Acinetobacter baumannii TCDC-AB0715]AHX30182.1 GntR family transcriptional regulator [Acinetobacter baumannii AC12]AHX65210.1 GntR family transcriptional regulator [Acinetobacter baumannii AC30]EMT90522.1 GntR family transcriptional regulator [Acinetobacter baumannii ABNIH5]EMT98000.1 GntR family transcriptional regulator [Acinetobacter baumannii ABNIH6]EMU15551.1 GntR family transcript